MGISAPPDQGDQNSQIRGMVAINSVKSAARKDPG
jgi:hypothetical protein